MDVLFRLVTNSYKKRNLALILTVFLFLGFSVQNGEAVGFETISELAGSRNFNSPESTLRGIEFTHPNMLDVGGPDVYGYQWDNTVSYSWKDPTGSTPLTFTSPDDGFAGPIEIGFVFPFYENSYSQLYASTNGYLIFENLKKTNSFPANTTIPNDIKPNNFLAPFWSDLAVGGSFNSGIVSTKQGSDGNGQFLQINYLAVSKQLSPSDLLTFQVILYQNGDIWFQYNTLAGDLSATVGIEDGDGVDGLEYTGTLQNSLAIRFQRPGDEARVKVLPTFQSGVTQFGLHNFFLQVRNTGELGSDTYNLTTLDEPGGSSGWLITLWEEDGSQGLTDTNGDTIVDTGVLSQGETRTILVRLQAPFGGTTGSYSSFLVTATSVLASEKTSEARFQAAIPAGHFIAFGNSAGLDLGRITNNSQNLFDVTDFGDNPSLILARNHYFYAWEDADFNPGTDIEYAVLDYGGHDVQPPTKLTNNATAQYPTRDFSTALAISPNNRIGVVWVRRLFDAGPPLRGENYNVYFAILDINGDVLVEPINVTNNGPCDPPEPDTCWQIGNDIDVPVFSSPVIMATNDNRFVISWIDSRILPGGDVTDIGYVVYDTDGNALIPADDLKNGNTGGDLYSGPRLVQLTNQRMLVTYSVFNPITDEFIPAYGVYSTDPETIGVEIQEDHLFKGTTGINPDSVLLTNSKILVAWTNTTNQQIECGILTDDGELITFDGQFTDLPMPDNRDSNFVSVLATDDGLGVLSWVDAEGGNRVYYALVDSAGDIVTPPIIAWIDNETIAVSQTGQGLAPIPDWRVFMPIISR